MRDTLRGDEIVRHSGENRRRRIKSLRLTDAPYGTVKLVLSRYIPANSAYALQTDMWDIGYLRDFQILDSGRDGDQERRSLLAEWTLVCKNPLANAKAHGVT